MEDWNVIVVGAGPAGLMAACHAAQRGRKTLLVDRNPRPGVKILLSGGSRCNLTHATDQRGIVEAFGPPGRFLHSALALLGPHEVVELFEAEGVPTAVEPGGKVFPASDRAADVLAALVRRLDRSGASVLPGETIQEIQRTDDGFRLTTARQDLLAERIILATGGRSYPQCGTTGDGYRWAAGLGHTIVSPRPALVPITTHAPWVRRLQGITLPDIAVQVIEPGGDGKAAKPRTLAERRGAVLLAHFGLTGPAVLDVSRAVSGHAEPQRLVLRCDLLPDLKGAELQSQLDADSRAAGKKQIIGVLDRWLPRRLAEALVELANVPSQTRAAELARPKRQELVRWIKGLEIPLSGTMGFRKAEVTAGGVSLDEVDSRSMESRLVPGLYFAGELLDLDGPIGGYNFQAAFSTGWLAGEKV